MGNKPSWKKHDKTRWPKKQKTRPSKTNKTTGQKTEFYVVWIDFNVTKYECGLPKVLGMLWDHRWQSSKALWEWSWSSPTGWWAEKLEGETDVPQSSKLGENKVGLILRFDWQHAGVNIDLFGVKNCFHQDVQAPAVKICLKKTHEPHQLDDRASNMWVS